MKHKGIWIISIILLIVIAIMIWAYPKFLFAKAILSLKEVDSVHMEGTFRLSKEDYELELQGTANYANHFIHSSLSTNYSWNPLKAEMYIGLHKKDVDFYLTTNVSEEWVKSNQKLESGSGFDDISISDIHFQKVKSDRKGELKYKVTLSKEMFQNLLASISKDSEVEEKMVVYFYVKDSVLSGIKIEDKILLSKKDNLYISNIDLKLTSFNGVADIVLPKEIEENSKEIDKNVLETLFSK